MSLSKAITNGAEGKILAQTDDNGLNSINNLLSGIRELAVQGGSSTLTTADRNTLQVEIDAYLAEIDSITKLVKFNTTKLLDGSVDKVSFLIVPARIFSLLYIKPTLCPHNLNDYE